MGALWPRSQDKNRILKLKKFSTLIRCQQLVRFRHHNKGAGNVRDVGFAGALIPDLSSVELDQPEERLVAGRGHRCFSVAGQPDWNAGLIGPRGEVGGGLD